MTTTKQSERSLEVISTSVHKECKRHTVDARRVNRLSRTVTVPAKGKDWLNTPFLLPKLATRGIIGM